MHHHSQHIFFFTFKLCVYTCAQMKQIFSHSECLILLLYVHECLPECVSVSYVHVHCPKRLEEDVGIPETGVADSCELRCGRWERSLEEPSGLLTSELSLQSLWYFLN